MENKEIAYMARVAERLEELGYDIESFNEDKEIHEHCDNGNPAVYCGTWAKYNDGNLDGMWIDLTTFSDYDEFINFCNALHADEEDPELMFQDYEGFPLSWYDEWISEQTFNKIQSYTELCEKYEQDAVDAWLCICCDDELEKFEEFYIGEYRSEEEFAEELFNECYCDAIRCLPDSMRDYFDYERFAQHLFSSGYEFCDGYVFLTSY